MKNIVKILALTFLAFAAFRIFSEPAAATESVNSKKVLTYLVVGLDDASENTDVIMTVSYNSSNNSVQIIQIPRDTYVSFKEYKGKINGLYPHTVFSGEGREKAMCFLKEKVSLLLGISIDGYIGVTHKGFVDFINLLGGVDIDASAGFDGLIDESQIENSRIHLDGETAYRFVRYRKGYVRADLERMDAQKIFIKAVFERLLQARDVASLILEGAKSEGVFYDVNRPLSASFFIQNLFRIRSAALDMKTLPGEARKESGVWYYFVDKSKSEALIESYFSKERRAFDSENGFVIKKQ